MVKGLTKKGQRNALWDNRLTIDQRIDYLLANLTLEEKFQCMGTGCPEIERLGIHQFSVGGEGAHGVQARHDQIYDKGEPDYTTIFPNPIGMSATWDESLIEQAGIVVGNEARGVFTKERKGGLSLWAPTVDMERDPRWGRTEEAYGEDPHLAGVMAGAYVQGMKGNDPFYIRCGATLKHFYANNVEEGRTYVSSSIDPRNKYEYYLEPFRHVIKECGAEALMTAYNEINGVPCILNDEVQSIAKDRWGVKHVVCDGGDVAQTVNQHGYFASDAETIAEGLKAGIDCFTDEASAVEYAVREAYDRGMITVEQMDEAIRNHFATMIRLGLFDDVGDNPYGMIGYEQVSTEANQDVALKVGQESVIMLENDGILPLDVDEKSIGIIGPLADVWQLDWYSGLPPYTVTPLEGMSKYSDAHYEKGVCQYKIVVGDNRYLGLMEDNSIGVVAESKAEIFEIEQWDNKQITIRAMSNNMFLTVEDNVDDGEQCVVRACKDRAFGWFVKEAFHIADSNILFDGSLSCGISSWNDDALYIDDEDRLRIKMKKHADSKGDNTNCELETDTLKCIFECVHDGIEAAVKLAESVKYPVLFLGADPMITCKEDMDRDGIDFPAYQEKLLKLVYAVNPNVILVLVSNVSFDISWAKEHVRAILLTASGCMRIGEAVADNIYGKVSPAGRLNMTWYKSLSSLPAKDDYDIIRHPRTYAYFEGDVLYPFGYGLTYGDITYDKLNVRIQDYTELVVSLDITNKGTFATDEVVQIYIAKQKSAVKKALQKLKAFKRIKEIAPGEHRHVEWSIPLSELRYYDVVSESMMLEDGVYQVRAGASSVDIRLREDIYIKGRKRKSLNAFNEIKADHYDDYDKVFIHKGFKGRTAVCTQTKDESGVLIYNGVSAGCCESAMGAMSVDTAEIENTEEKRLWCQVDAHVNKGSSINIYADDILIGSYINDDKQDEEVHNKEGWASLQVDKKKVWPAFMREMDFTQIKIEIDRDKMPHRDYTLKIVLDGYVRICSWKFVC